MAGDRVSEMGDHMNANREDAAEVRRYRKRPVEVEALRYDGPAWVPESERFSVEAWRPVMRFTNGGATSVQVGTVTHGGPNQFALAIRTLEGNMRVSPGDYIIKGVQGEFYPCKPDIFDATYEPVAEQSGSSAASRSGVDS